MTTSWNAWKKLGKQVECLKRISNLVESLLWCFWTAAACACISPKSLSQSFYPGIRNLHTKDIDCYRSVSICIDLLETELNAIRQEPSRSHHKRAAIFTLLSKLKGGPGRETLHISRTRPIHQDYVPVQVGSNAGVWDARAPTAEWGVRRRGQPRGLRKERSIQGQFQAIKSLLPETLRACYFLSSSKNI